MCLYGFVFALSLSLFVGEELAPPVAPNLSISTTFAKEHLSLAFLAPPVAPNTAIPTTIAKPHYPSKSTISLPPLSKVRCCRPKKIRATTGGIALHPPTSQFPQPLQKDIPRFAPSPLPYERSAGFASLRNSGRSTSVIHARPLSKVRCCRPKKFGRLPEGLLYAHQPLHPHNHCKMTIIPRPAPSRLPPLSKGGGLTARHKLSLSCVLLATRPPLYSLNFYAVKTEGLLYHPSPRTIPFAFRRVSVCVCLVGFASIAIVVVCGRCVLHRLFATTCKHPCLKPLGTHA